MTDKIKWDQLLRFRLIEIISLWEGRLTTNHISSIFKIGRQQASRDIAYYQTQFAKEPLILDYAIKGYRPSDTFTPKFTRGTANEYLTLLHQQGELLTELSPLQFGCSESVMLNTPERKISPAIVRGLLKAAREQKWISIDYISLKSPAVEKRRIAPHTLVNDGFRWHIRAYTEKDNDYRDFVLSRFRGTPEVKEKSDSGKDGDVDWHNLITKTVIPNPNLTLEQQEVVAYDYDMKNNKLIVEARKALMNYTLNRLAVCFDPVLLKKHPKRFQLTTE
jgi:predicted DNA-binding transcriptional regulator YafY